VEAQRDGSTVNNLLNSVMREYVEFTSIGDKMNRVTMSEATLTGFLDYLSPDECMENGLRLGATEPRQMLMMDGRSLGIESLAVILDRAGDRDGWFRYSVHSDPRKGYIFINNRLGPKWCSFLQGWFTGLVRSLGSELMIEPVEENLILKVIGT
jgi:hypothetical protein